MAREHNFLLSQGERLALKVPIRKAGGEKALPYDLKTAKARIGARLARVDAQLALLPDDACPRGEAVAIVTLHPRFLSKSDYPSELFSAVGLRAVGSRSRTIRPEEWGVNKHGEDAVTEDIFVAGAKSAFHRWSTSVKKWTENTKGAASLSHIEDLTAFDAKSKLRAIPEGKGVLLEVVLHNSGGDEVVLAFIQYARARGAEPLIARRRDVQGLTFLPVRVDPSNAEDIARFSFVRVARGMPSLRPFRPSLLRGASGFDVRLPTEAPVDRVSRAVIFDGGLPTAARAALAPGRNSSTNDVRGDDSLAHLVHGELVKHRLEGGPIPRYAAVEGRPCAIVDHEGESLAAMNASCRDKKTPPGLA